MVMLAVMSLVSCKTWDFVNPDVCIMIMDDSGNNLLDPDAEVNILSNNITVDYDGQTHSLLRTRDSGPARWQGLRIEPYSSSNNSPVLKFGEFKTTSGSSSYRGEVFTINWGDGTSDEVQFDLYVRGTHNVIEKIWLNGELQSDDSLVVTIVK